MSKISLFLILIVFILDCFACENSINNEEVILFIDTNKSEKEILTAKKAACQRGQRFISIPQDYAILDPSFEETGLTKAGLDVALAALKNQGAKPVSLIISGHDGGGEFGGNKGRISREEILKSIDSDYPEFKDSIQSLYLLGCYTGVKSEMFAWLSKLPNLKMIGGYEGAAPLSDKLAGHTFLEDLMIKEKLLSEEAEQDKIQHILQDNIRNMQMLNSAVFVKSAQCVEGDHYKSYYYRPIPKIKGDPKFEEFDKNDCLRKLEMAQKYLIEFNQYYESAINIPRDVATGNPIRNIYSFFRNADHCFDGLYNMPSSEQVLAILFYHSYKKNIVQYLQPSYQELKDELALLTPESWRASIEKNIVDAKRNMAEDQKRYEAFIANPEGVRAKTKMEFDNLNSELQDLSTPDLNSAFVAVSPNEKQRALINEFNKKSDQMYKISSNISDMQSPENYKLNLSLRTNFLNQFIKDSEQQLGRVNQEAIEQVKRNIWVPTVEEVEKMERKEINDKINNYYNAATSISHTLPQSLQNKIASVASASNTYLNNMQCLPLSWHEYSPQNTDQPTCQAMGYGFFRHGMGGGYGGGTTGNDSPTGGGRATGDNSESFEEDDRD